MKPQPMLGIAIGDALGMPFETLDHTSSALTAQTQTEMLAIGAGGSCHEIVGTALACLLTTSTYEEAVTTAIRLGGDTDTRAAVVGGWAAITREIPKKWVREVEGAEMLMALDQRLNDGKWLT